MNKRVKCNWLDCAHGVEVAYNEGERCYAGDPTDEHCKGFTTEEKMTLEREAEIKEEVQKEVRCPFCGQDNFDLPGLKLHLTMKGWCPYYDDIEDLDREAQ